MKLGNIYYLTSIDLLQPFSTKSNFYPLVDIWQCLETFLVVTAGKETATGIERVEPGLLLSLQGAGEPPNEESCSPDAGSVQAEKPSPG